MTTDRELLELVAKAAGVEEGENRIDCGISTTTSDGRHGYLPRWNPLTDDGDALRLAVKLHLSVETYPIYAPIKHAVIVKQRRRSDTFREPNPTEISELYGDDPYAATRRAIVRAAAEIGRAME